VRRKRAARAAVTEGLESYKFNEAAAAIYEFVLGDLLRLVISS